MTRKEQKIVADVLREHTVGQDRQQYVHLCHEMARALVLGTRPFDRGAFLEMCELLPHEVRDR